MYSQTLEVDAVFNPKKALFDDILVAVDRHGYLLTESKPGRSPAQSPRLVP
jgi:hypothetical protein